MEGQVSKHSSDGIHQHTHTQRHGNHWHVDTQASFLEPSIDRNRRDVALRRRSVRGCGTDTGSHTHLPGNQSICKGQK